MKKKTIENLLFGIVIAVGAICLFVLLMSFYFQASGPEPSDFGRTQEGEGVSEYTVFHIEGMPCVWMEHAIGSVGYAGLSCDWSRWNGE